MLSLASLAILRIAAILTAFYAASSRSSVTIMLNPESYIICLAYSSIVPLSLKTIGFFMPVTLIPLINPNAMTSHLAIPAKILTKTA
jgi:hypothetical protein